MSSPSSAPAPTSAVKKVGAKIQERNLHKKSNNAVKQAQITAAIYARIAAGEGQTLQSSEFKKKLLMGFKFAIELIWDVYTKQFSLDSLDDIQKFAFGFAFNAVTLKKVMLALPLAAAAAAAAPSRCTLRHRRHIQPRRCPRRHR